MCSVIENNFRSITINYSIFYTAGKEDQFKEKRALVMCVGTDAVKEIDVCVNNISDNFCETLGLQIVGKQSFRSHSELKGNYNDIFEGDLNPEMEGRLEEMAEALFG